MKLFDDPIDPERNLLPRDGIVHYYGPVLASETADRFLDCLLETIPWRPDEAVRFGRRYVTRRQVAWYADVPYEYTYSNTTKRALPWTDELLELKNLVEGRTGETFNSCLLNHYPTGAEGVGWHSDGEKDLKKDGAIASLSFGAERRFLFRHKQTKESVSIVLPHGSLLIMKGPTQTHWLHRLPPMAGVHRSRISLTFRTLVG